MAWDTSSWNPSNWFGGGTSTALDPSNTLDFSGYASPMTAGQSGIGGFSAPTADDPSTSTSQTGNTGSSSGGMNWAGLSSGLGKLSEALKSSTASSDPMQGSRSVASTVSGGSMSPAGAGGGASALASADSARQQLASYLILAAMQGKGRGKSGGGLLG